MRDAAKQASDGVKKTVDSVNDGLKKAVSDVQNAVKDTAKKMSDAAKPKASRGRRRVVGRGVVDLSLNSDR